MTDLRQLEQPLPAVFRCKVKLAIRRDDDGNENNRVRRFDVLEVVKPEPDAFAPDVAPMPQTDAGHDDGGIKTANDLFDDAGRRRPAMWGVVLVNDAMPYGYRIVGPCDRERRIGRI